MNDRILRLIQELGLSPAQFADEIGVQRSSISHILSGRNKPSLDFMLKIMTAFPEVSHDWLLFGKGSLEKQIIARKPDLFTQADPNQGVEDLSKPEPDHLNEPTKPEVVEEDVEKSPNPRGLNENRAEEMEIKKPKNPSDVGSEKYPVRLMLLFNDGTFTSYRPGESEAF